MSVSVTPTIIPEVLVIEPTVRNDARGFFFESYNARHFRSATGIDVTFVQDNHSGSSQGVLRGMHYQLKRSQAKLVRVLAGEIFDVAVDLRKDSPTFGAWAGIRLSQENKKQLWIPEGFAHGFLVMSAWAEVSYKVTDYYNPEDERVLRWNDEQLAIAWPLERQPILASRDENAQGLEDILQSDSVPSFSEKKPKSQVL